MAFLLRRVSFYLAAFLAAATINFFLPRMMPGDPIQIMFASAGSNLSMENLNALKLTFGFIDAPVGEQYLTYLKSVFTGDLGVSIKYFPLPVTALLARALIWTVGLVGSATLLGFTLGTLLGIMAAWRRGTIFDTVVSLLAIFSSSVPAVVLSLIMLFVFGYTLGWFPNGYAADPMLDPAFSWQYISSVLYHVFSIPTWLRSPAQKLSAEMISPPWRVRSAATTSAVVESLRNRTDPSAIPTLAPPGWNP